DPSELVGTGYSIPGFTPGAVFFASFGGVKRLKLFEVHAKFVVRSLGLGFGPAHRAVTIIKTLNPPLRVNSE
ncbi:MAG: hypothetical protein PVJ19_23290, partial [Desulfobacteraceae bacterium]